MSQYLSRIDPQQIIYISHIILEIFILYIIIYCSIMFMKGTRAAYIFTGILGSLILLTIASFSMDFAVLNWIVSQFWAALALACVVIFQPELRRAFAYLGSGRFRNSQSLHKECIEEICIAMNYMSDHRIGALIVIERNESVKEESASGGVDLEAQVSAPLLEAIFSTKSPIHDGAVIINENKIIAAHMILPLANSSKEHIGTRHRAGMGITEETDAVALVVSEETGRISIVQDGKVTTDIAPYKLNDLLISALSHHASKESKSEKSL